MVLDKFLGDSEMKRHNGERCIHGNYFVFISVIISNSNLVSIQDEPQKNACERVSRQG